MAEPPERLSSPTPALVRRRRANRDQVTPVPAYLDALLPDDHLARLLWQTVDQVDLAAFAAGLSVHEGGPGRAAADPAVLVARWRYATTQGVTSARALDRRCGEHVAYSWLCGGVTMTDHSLSDVRVEHAAALDALMTQVVGRLRHAGLIAFDHVAQDGGRVRASAGAASFHRQAPLEQALAEAEALLAGLRAGGPPDDEPRAARQRAARARAARARVERLKAALAAMPAAQAAQEPAQRAQARVSDTDPEARVMKLADGGVRPADTVQLAADTARHVIVGVEVSTSGSDLAQAPGMVAPVAQRTGALPADWLMDGGFAGQPASEHLDAAGVRALAPVAKPKAPDRDPHQPLPSDSPALAAWRVRLGLDDITLLYRLRAATIECVNAQARVRHGLTQVRVRGVVKVRCVALWIALAHNLKLLVKRLVTAPPAPAPADAGGA